MTNTKAQIESALSLLDKEFPGPSREKALVRTKLEEALLWLRALEESVTGG